ncbi:MAG: HPr-like protein Crh [Candidatus Moanabacter tarae]|uniref:HPr-like protein Crh n=1 Tax=Candidatus Moanibacter tarae TaxID=2200854 RepID=A0A2Z4ACJ4_9BACT|nr:MAG: HPr-like protein Crh [Candidatus Moanabacter tarae]|tara:strand:- start:4799 stop:5101 length:303 start_codon:yes stop_codon:yes gene_type:complete
MTQLDNKPPDQPKTEKTLVVKNKMGIHARPAAMIVKTTNRYTGEIFVEKDEELVNGKSIMGLMMLAAGQGSELKFTLIGSNPNPILDELSKLFESQFEEV